MNSASSLRPLNSRGKLCWRGVLSLSRASGLGLLLLAGACSGEVSGSDLLGGAPVGPGAAPLEGSSEGDGMASEGLPGAPELPGGAQPPGPSGDCDGVPSVGEMPLKRISRQQYRNALRDILGLEISLQDELDVDNKVGSFNSNIEGAVSKIHVDRYEETAELVATRALENNPDLFDCAGIPADACATEQISQLARRFFGRTPTAEETTRLGGLYDAVKQATDFNTAMSSVLQGLLQSPNFLYQIESPAAPGVTALSGPEVARRLAAFLWSSVPDEALMVAAENGELATREQVGAQAGRMLTDPRASQLYTDFHSQWLRFDGVALELSLPDDAERQAVVAELGRFVAEVIGGGGNDVQALLTSRAAWVDPMTAETYGMAASGEQVVQVELPEAERAGLLTRAGFLAANPSVTARGVFVRKELLCEPPPPPPATVSTDLPDLGPDATERDVLAAHIENPACAGCHAYFDPIGLGFLNFDAHGRFEESDERGVIDNSGKLDAFEFRGVLELSDRLSEMEQVQRCVAEHWLSYAISRTAVAADKCSLESAIGHFELKGGSLPELAQALTMTDAFRFYSSN